MSVDEALRAWQNPGALNVVTELYQLRIDRAGVPPALQVVHAPVAKLGRSAGEVRIDDPAIRDPHVELHFVGGRLTVRDISGEGGLFFRGQPSSEIDLVSGQNFALGGTHFTLLPPGAQVGHGASMTAAHGPQAGSPHGMAHQFVPPPAPGTIPRGQGNRGMGLGITSIILGVFCPILGLLFGIIGLVTALSNKDKLWPSMIGIGISLLMTGVGVLMNAMGAY
jgi:hypothetical protein